MAPPETPHAFKEVVIEYSGVLGEQKIMRKRASELKAEVLAYMREHTIDEVDLRPSSSASAPRKPRG